MPERTADSPHTRSVLLLAALVISASAFAQMNSSELEGLSSHTSGMTNRTRACVDARKPSDERIRACTALIKDSGVHGRDLSTLYVHRARAAHSAQQDENAER